MARLTTKVTKPFKKKREWSIRHTKKRAKWDDKEESESVLFSMELEAGKRPEICLPSAKSVE